ncbi:MAG TPA: autotransporter-associated beta strand repeat-containing protein [Candidatus Sulfotelmatobacter sp.]|jgi:autotransporter-associated beta strand protein|nr:autotransporter-associated beta strand repeat-containing protein [Candidatus Sulfotelmatobacter sp.]
MKQQHSFLKNGTATLADVPNQRRSTLIKCLQVFVVLVAVLALWPQSSSAQQTPGIRFEFPQVRFTVPVNSTNLTFFAQPTTNIVNNNPATNNTIVTVYGATNANLALDLSGIPAGYAGIYLSDPNMNPVSGYVSGSSNICLVLNTTNLPEGVYTFWLNASGLDTNGLPTTNSMPFVLQAAHIWVGGISTVNSLTDNNGLGVTNSWGTLTNFLGGSPNANDDVVFSDAGSQTNATFATGVAFTNIYVTATTTIGSMRFAQNAYTNYNSVTNAFSATNAEYYSFWIGGGTIGATTPATLNVTGTNGFSILQDYIGAITPAPYPYASLGVFFSGTNGTLFVSNSAANFGILCPNAEQPTLCMSNLGTFVLYANRAGYSDFRSYPNYYPLSYAYDQGVGSNAYASPVKQMWNNIYLARTNTITATYADPNNYTNGYTRTYAMTVQNNEQQGNGSSTATYFYLGRTNNFYLDSIDFIGSSSASGNNGGVKYTVYEKNATNPGTLFRGTNGTSRLSIFSVSDDDGTNDASSNVKGVVDFTGASGGTGQGYINLLADRLYIARDRTMITSNQTPNVQGDLYFGNGAVDVNSMYLGDQEHSNKVDWTSMGGAAYLNYCQGRLWLTNGGYLPSVIKVNKNLVLGYTADANPSASAQQYNTYGQIVLSSNVTLQVSNIVCDGGLNYYDGNGRQNNITILRGGNLIVTNAIGNLDFGSRFFVDPDPAGILLDNLSMSAATLTVFVNPGITNAYIRNFATPGTIPSIVKVASLTGTNSFPCQIPVIYCANTPSPFLNADVSSLGSGYHGYILNNAGNKTVDVYITTNPPNNLVWVGGQNNTWDTTSLNWVLSGTSTVTNFNLGDQVTFDDTSSVTNIFINASVVPSQTGVGVTITNNLKQYYFSGGTIAGTAAVVKSGTNLVDFEAVEQGPITIAAGTVISTGGSAGLGTTTVYTNVVLNWAGSINGGLTATGMVNLAAGGTLAGPVVLGLNTVLVNSATISTGSGNLITMLTGSSITNTGNGTINVGTGTGNGGTWDVTNGCTIANFGNINLYQPKLSVEGLLFGTGTITDPNQGGYDPASSPTLVRMNSYGVLSPGATPVGSLSNMTLHCRLDFNNDPQNGQSEGAGITTVRIEVDKSQSPPNDYFNIDRWNNDTGFLLMTNINPGAGSFAVGDVYQIFDNSSGFSYNYQDTPGFCPTMLPTQPGPNMVWGTTNFNLYGTITITTNTLVWSGGGNGSWDTNGSANNWKYSQTYSDFQGALFNDSASSTLVNITTNVAPLGSYIITNTDGLTYTNVITNQPDIYPGLIVNTAGNYVMSGQGHIRGITGLYKTGSGTLTLLTSNDFIGNVVVDGGTLAISNYNAVASIVSLGVQGSGAMENDLILDGATLNYLGLSNVQLSNGKNTELVLNAGGGTVNVNAAAITFFINKQMTGPGSLIKTGPGILQLQNTVDAYMGGTVVNAGSLQLTAAAAGFGPVTLNNSSALQLTNGMTLTNQITISSGATASIQALGSGTNVFSGIWTGSGSVTFSNGAICVFNSSMNGFSGALSLGPSTGLFQFNNVTNASTVCTGSIAASFDLGSGSATLANLYGGALTYNLGSLAGGPNTILTGRQTNNLVVSAGSTYSIGANNNSSSFNGRITNGLDTVTVAKVGAGTLWLNGNNTYTGNTTVSGGTLSGTGSISSPLTVVSGGTLSAGASATTPGTFTVSNNVTLGGTTLLKINQSLTPANDEITLPPIYAFTGGGALVVTNLGGTITNGSTFYLFSQHVSGFSSITLPTGGTGYVWTTNLATSGSITLVSGGVAGVNTNPTNIVATVSGSTLTLKWPSDHTGWRLLAQTDSLSSGLNATPTNWFYVNGSSSTNQVTITINPANPTVFYRLTYP